MAHRDHDRGLASQHQSRNENSHDKKQSPHLASLILRTNRTKSRGAALPVHAGHSPRSGKLPVEPALGVPELGFTTRADARSFDGRRAALQSLSLGFAAGPAQ